MSLTDKPPILTAEQVQELRDYWGTVPRLDGASNLVNSHAAIMDLLDSHEALRAERDRAVEALDDQIAHGAQNPGSHPRCSAYAKLGKAEAERDDAYRQNEMLLALNGPLVAGGAEWKTRAETAHAEAAKLRALCKQAAEALAHTQQYIDYHNRCEAQLFAGQHIVTEALAALREAVAE